MKFDRRLLADKELIDIYNRLLLPRMIEEKMLIYLRQGKISKWFSGVGQEAISVGCALAMDDEEYILTMHRNLGVFTTRNIPLERLFAQFQGKAEGFTKGRDRSFHFGSKEHKIVGMAIGIRKDQQDWINDHPGFRISKFIRDKIDEYIQKKEQYDKEKTQ